MATVTCSDLWVNTVTSSGHSRDKFLSHHVSGCYRVQCDNNNREMIETPTKTGSPRAPISAPSRAEPGARSPAESRPRLSLASLSLSVGNSRTKSWGRAVTRPAPSTCQPRPGHKWLWWQWAWTKFLLFSRIYLLLWNTDWVFSVIQGINRRSSAESRLSSWLIA